MQRLMLKNVAFGVSEMYRSFSMRAQVRQAQRLMPSLRVEDVLRYWLP